LLHCAYESAFNTIAQTLSKKMDFCRRKVSHAGGALPTWPYSDVWGYYPSGDLGILLIIAIILMLMAICSASCKLSIWIVCANARKGKKADAVESIHSFEPISLRFTCLGRGQPVFFAPIDQQVSCGNHKDREYDR
jgi:hypothetical protein